MSLYPVSPNLIPGDSAAWGTSLPLGSRMGVAAPDNAPQYYLDDHTSDPYYGNNVSLGSYYDKWGVGMFRSPLFTHRIRPGRTTYAISNGYPTPDISSISNPHNHQSNTVYPLPLYGSTTPNCAAVKLYNGTTPYLQFDVPRSISVWGNALLTGGDTVNIRLWIYGTDFYGMPKTYMAYIPFESNDAVTGLLYETPSCFYTVNYLQIAFDGDTQEIDGEIDIVTGFNFGLPYLLAQIPHVIGYSQGDEVLSGTPAPYYNEESSFYYPLGFVVDTSGPPPAVGAITPWFIGSPVADVPVTVTTNIIQTGIVTGSDYTTPQNLKSPDNRGYIHPNNVSDWSTSNPLTGSIVTTGNFPAGATLTTTYYVQGADMFQQQVNVMRGLWYGYPGQGGLNPPIANLGYQVPPTVGVATTYGGVLDPMNIYALKGAVPYYELPSLANPMS